MLLRILAILLITICFKNGANLPEKPLAVVVTSYNNKDWYKANLDSIFSQDYSNYRVIYLDDASPDGTGQLVEQYLQDKNLEHKVTLVQRKEWVSQMANHYDAVHMCDDNEIVVHVDGDDELYGTQVFKIINDLYTKNDIWLTYGSPLFMPSGIRWNGMSPDVMEDIMKNNAFRNRGWEFTHLRTFYAWLFKQIKLQDLILRGSFKPMSPAPDVAFMLPLCELAGLKSMAIQDLVYIYNEKNPISQFKITSCDQLQALIKLFYSWAKYQPLKAPVIESSKQYEASTADVIVLADQNYQLEPFLTSLKKQLTGIGKISVIYQAPVPPALTQKFSDITFVAPYSRYAPLKKVLQNIIDSSQSHIIFCSIGYTPLQVIKPVNINSCIRELERTFSYGFYLHLSSSNLLTEISTRLSDEFVAWQPKYSKHIWPQPNSLGMILYRKKDIAKAVATMSFQTLRGFFKMWADYEPEDRSTGLIFRESKVR